MRIALCQINTTVGDIEGNLQKIAAYAELAAKQGADLALFPEMTIAGYPPEDLLLRPRFLDACDKVMRTSPPTLPIPALIGGPIRTSASTCANAAALIRDGKTEALYEKMLLPNYAVFDEKRYFTPGTTGMALDVAGAKIGVVICEDAWELHGPVELEVARGASVILCLSASPYHHKKHFLRQEVFGNLCRTHNVTFVYCNLVGGQDELVFDGGSMVMTPAGEIILHAAEFREDMICFDINPVIREGIELEKKVQLVPFPINATTKPPLPCQDAEKLSPEAELYECCMLGLRDYVHKNGFTKVAIGLSGGIDSALTAAIAVDALGKENVVGVTMPSRYSSEETRSDAEVLATKLGIEFHSIPIEGPFAAFESALAPVFGNRPPDITEENLQARIRGMYLMALANKFGYLVLNTSNKSESAVGYGTMYGDMVGGFAVLKDMLKTMVFRVSWYVNERHGREVIPETTITRPPSAELRADQKDSDSLPEYDELDPVLQLYIEEDTGVDEIIARGHAAEVVERAVRMTDRAEWKRRQSVPGVRLSGKAFGKDRRMPITNRFKG